MNTIDAIMNRVSVREYRDEVISKEDVKTILKAAMAGPSCANARDWSFVVVDDRDLLGKMAKANGRPAALLEHAPLAIMICGDLSRSFPIAPEYWVIDGAIAGQNMVLAAKDLGIGSVWLGTWPQMERVSKQQELFGLDANQVPHSIIAFGYPLEEKGVSKGKLIYEEDRVHFNKW